MRHKSRTTVHLKDRRPWESELQTHKNESFSFKPKINLAIFGSTQNRKREEDSCQTTRGDLVEKDKDVASLHINF